MPLTLEATAVYEPGASVTSTTESLLAGLVSGKAKKGPLDRVASETGTLQETPSRLYRDVKGALTWIVDEAAVKG